MSLSYISEEKIVQSLNNFSKGNVFDLFQLALSSLYESRDVIKNPEFILNMFNNFRKHEEKMQFIDLLLDNRIDLLQEYTINPTDISDPNSVTLNHYNLFWNNKLPNSAPLLFFIIPYLSDSQLQKIIQRHPLYDLEGNPNIKTFAEVTTLKLFQRGFSESLIELKNQYLFIRELDLYKVISEDKEENKKTINDTLLDYVYSNPKVLIAYSKFTYSSVEGLCDMWFNHHTSKDEVNEDLIQDFIKEVFPKLHEEEKENVITHTLEKTSSLSLCKSALKQMGIEKLSQYNPKRYPIWLYSGSHKNINIFSKLLRSGVDLFDYYTFGNKVFLSCVIENSSRRDFKKALADRKIDYTDVVKRLLEERVDTNDIKYTNYSLLCTTGDSIYHDILNLKKEDWPLLSKKLTPERYDSLSTNKKLEVLNPIMDNTILSEVYIPKDMVYSKHLQKRAINFNAFMNNEYSPFEGIHLIDEHLSLLAETGKYDYTEKYFKIVSQLFDIYATRHVSEDSNIFKTYTRMIDYVATNKNLDWNNLHEFLCSEKIEKELSSYEPGAKTLFSYLKRVSLSYSLNTNTNTEKKKLKI